VERALADVWQSVLGVDEVGADDNFFSLGGDSIRSTQMIARARRLGYEFSVRDVLTQPTIAGLARLALPAALLATPRFDATDTRDLPLLPMQQWFFAVTDGTPRFNQAVVLHSRVPLQAAPLLAAVNDLVARHEALRLRFPLGRNGSRTVVLVDAAVAALRLGADQAFDLESGPLMSAELSGDPSATLTLTAHHLVVDGVSWRTLVGDLQTAYQARVEGRTPVFADEAPSYVGWAKAQAAFAATPVADAEAIHWLTENWDLGSPTLPAAALPAGAGLVGVGEVVFDVAVSPLPGPEAEAMLLASLAAALEPASTALRVDLEGHGRAPVPGADGSSVVGWCASLYPALLRIEGESPSARAASVSRQLAEIPAGGRAYGLCRYLSPRPRLRDALAAAPASAILFNYLGQVDRALAPGSMFTLSAPGAGSLRDASTPPAYALEINAHQGQGDLRVSLRFDRARVSAHWIAALAERWRSLVAAAAGQSYPLTPMQNGMLFHALLQPDSGSYVQQLVATFDGAADEALVRAAWDAVLERHSVLRNGFAWKGLAAPVQQPASRVTMPWSTEDCRGLTDEAFDAALASFLDADRRQGIDLSTPPLHRVRLFIRDAGGVMVWTHHHILLDGRSMFLVLHEVLESVRRIASATPPLPPAAGSFTSFAAGSDRAVPAAALDYWRAQLDGVDGPTPIPFLQRAAAAGHYRPAEMVRTLPPAEAEQLRRLAREAGVTLNVLTQSLLALLLARLSGLDRVMFGATVSTGAQDDHAVGLFINTVPIVTDVPAGATLGAWLGDQLRQQAERSAFEQTGLVDVQRCGRIEAGEPLFDLLFLFENYGVDAALRRPAAGLVLRGVRVVEQTNIPVVLSVLPADTIELRLHHDSERYPREAAQLLLDGLAGLLRAAARDGLNTPLAALARVDADTRRTLLEDRNNSRVAYPRDRCVHDLIREQVARTPEAIAVRSGAVTLTYREIDARARAIAAALVARGVGAGSTVGLCITRGPEMMPALLGVLAAGAAYVPLDPSFPADRLAYMLQDSGAALVLSEREVEDGLRARLEAATPMLLLEDIGAATGADQLSGPPSTSDAMMYVLYTSGSTGKPKGVMVRHRSVVNLLWGMKDSPGMSASDVVLAITTLSFDIAVVELFLPLTVGATIVLVDDLDSLEPKRIIRHLAGVTVMQATPSRYRLLIEAGWQGAPGLVAFSGGEALPRDLAREILERSSRLWNLYAPTETTVYSLAAEIGRDDQGAVPIGRPMANVRAYVLDAALEPVPVGAIGELFIGGDGVAVGYRNNPQLTDERFLPDPFDSRPGARMYRTADRARWRLDGTLDYLGRLDHQVKIRGYRVELGEIESVLGTHPAVARSAVVIREDRPGDVRLIAYYAVHDGQVVEQAELREHLQSRLPAYMLPSMFIPVDRIPLTPNGKVDARSLPVPLADRPVPAAVLAQSAVERELAAVFADVLGLAMVPVDESFFNLGGHSLLLIGVQTRIADRLGAEIEMVDFFRHPTIRDLAPLVERLQRGEAAVAGPMPVRATARPGTGARQTQLDLRRAARTRKKDA